MPSQRSPEAMAVLHADILKDVLAAESLVCQPNLHNPCTVVLWTLKKLITWIFWVLWALSKSRVLGASFCNTKGSGGVLGKKRSEVLPNVSEAFFIAKKPAYHGA